MCSSHHHYHHHHHHHRDRVQLDSPPKHLSRAYDLGVAMQLTNIARDVGEDARNGRVYLPADWLLEVRHKSMNSRFGLSTGGGVHRPARSETMPPLHTGSEACIISHSLATNHNSVRRISLAFAQKSKIMSIMYLASSMDQSDVCAGGGRRVWNQGSL